jgi:hypothetical protein
MDEKIAGSGNLEMVDVYQQAALPWRLITVSTTTTHRHHLPSLFSETLRFSPFDINRYCNITVKPPLSSHYPHILSIMFATTEYLGRPKSFSES